MKRISLFLKRQACRKRAGTVIVTHAGAKALVVLELMIRMHRAAQEKFDLAFEPEVVLLEGLSASRNVAARAWPRLTRGKGEDIRLLPEGPA